MAAVEVDKVADMVADMVADKKNMADMELDMVANMEVDKAAEMRWTSTQHQYLHGWLIGPKLFRSEAYPSVMMMLMSMMATPMISGTY